MIRLFLSCLFALFLASCSTNPVTGEKEFQVISEAQEISMGEQSFGLMQQAEGGDYVTDLEVQTYVKKVGMRLAQVSDRPQLPYEFVVLNNSIPNAWALPGGKIAINRGLLTELKSEAELAAVLSHEIVHSAARHGAKAMERGMLMQAGLATLSQILQNHSYEEAVVIAAQTGTGLIHLKYSRSAESEADQYGIKYMVAAGYDPEAAVDLQETFLRLSEDKNPNWLEGLFASHPPSSQRIEANKETAALYPPRGFLGVKEYESAMATLKKDRPAYENLDNGYKALLDEKYQEALSLAEKGIAIEPREAHLFNLKGKAEVKLQYYESALASFTRAIDLNSNYFDFYLQRGQLEYQLGDLTTAERDLDRSNTLLPSAEAHYLLGEINLHQGKEAQAMHHFQIAAHANSPAGRLALRRIQQLSS